MIKMTLLVEIEQIWPASSSLKQAVQNCSWFVVGAAISATRKNTTKVILILLVPIAHTLLSKPSILLLQQAIENKAVVPFHVCKLLLYHSATSTYIFLSVDFVLGSTFNTRMKSKRTNVKVQQVSIDRS